MAKNVYNIESFEDLKFAQEQIRKDNEDIELAFKDNPVIKISSSLLGGESIKETISNNLFTGDRRQSGAKMIKALLLANKFTRKYFVGYTIAKEMVPYTLHKVNQLLHNK